MRTTPHAATDIPPEAAPNARARGEGSAPTRAGKILLIDSGMRNLGGHNFTYTRAVQGALEERGFVVTVLANKNLSVEIARDHGYHQTFSVGAYDFFHGNGFWRDLTYAYAQSVLFCEELEAAARRHSIDEFDLIFCHTVADFELIGWNRFLRRHRLSSRLAILQRSTPGFQGQGHLKPKFHPYWRVKPHYLDAIRSRMGDAFLLVTDSELLTLDFASVYKNPIVTLPIPINQLITGEAGRTPERSPSAVPGDAIRVGYMGDARPSKGFPLLSRMVEQILARGTRQPLRFVFQCPNSATGNQSQRPEEGVEELILLRDQHPDQVELIPHRLTEREYADLLLSLDVVLLPYDHPNYRTATSGIFAEALAMGKPVVVPSGTWMAHELRKNGGGVAFEPGDVTDLADKVAEVVARHPHYSDRAARSRAGWNAFHNARSLVDILLRETDVRRS